jgi:hypothetical protein
MKVGTSLYTRVYIRCTYFFCTPFVYPARGHNVFVLSNSRDHRFSHPSPTFKNERKKILLPSILSLFTFTSFNLIFSSFSPSHFVIMSFLESFTDCHQRICFNRESNPEPLIYKLVFIRCATSY